MSSKNKQHFYSFRIGFPRRQVRYKRIGCISEKYGQSFVRPDEGRLYDISTGNDKNVRSAASLDFAQKLLSKRLRRFAGAICLAALTVSVISTFRQNRIAACKQEDMMLLVEATASTPVDPDTPKTVYLTFDDGPSENTEKVLDILKEQQVPASFFVVGAENNLTYFPLLQRTAEEGHCIGLHTCTHEYQKIYTGSASYWTDIEALKMELTEQLGERNYTVLRFPGGSSNTVSHKYGGDGLMEQLKQEAMQKGYTVVDWNVSAEDSVGGNPSSNTIASRVIKGCKDKAQAVVLMHDSATNDNTVAALNTVINWLKENSYTFDTVDHLPSA